MAKYKGNRRAESGGKTNIPEHRQEARQSHAIDPSALRQADRRKADQLVDKYLKNRFVFQAMGEAVFELLTKDEELRGRIHSVKYRVKDAEHLRDKLYRKCLKARQERRAFEIDEENLYQKINDLVGLRILHLHTSEIVEIDRKLRELMTAEQFTLLEGPTAKTWDDESRKFFSSVNIATEESKTQYTSVHYVFNTQNDYKSTLEIQVRTLAEELWGEVDHKINYPHRHKALACTEQIAVLARVTSSCTRLVDSIFRTHDEWGRL